MARSNNQSERQAFLASLASKPTRRRSYMPEDQAEKCLFDDIETQEQLQEATGSELVAEFAEWFAERKTEYNEAIRLLEQCHQENTVLTLQSQKALDRQDRLQKDLEAQGQRLLTLNQEVQELRSQSVDAPDIALRIERNELLDRVQGLEDELYRERQIRHETPATIGTTREGRSAKQPDPDKFSGVKGERPIFELWYNEIVYKLTINADHFESEHAKIGYIVGRTKDEASEMLLPYVSGEYQSMRWTTKDQALAFLKSVYADPNKKQKALADFQDLKMDSRDRFLPFFVKYLTLCSILGYEGNNQMDQLLLRLPKRLKDTLISRGSNDFPDLEAMKSFFQNADSSQEISYRASKTAKVESGRTSPRPKPARVTTTPVANAQGQAGPPGREGTPLVCFGCRRTGHKITDCTDEAAKAKHYANKKAATRAEIDAIMAESKN